MMNSHLTKSYKSLFQNELNRFYQMSTSQLLQFLKKFNNSAAMGEKNETLNLSITPEDSGLLYPPYSILVEIFKEADELLPDGVGYAPGAPDNVKVVKNTQDVVEHVIVIFNRDNGIVKCKSACDRFKAYNFYEHSLSVAENEGFLNRFLQYLEQRQSSRFTSQGISNIINVDKSGNTGKKRTKSTSKRKEEANKNKETYAEHSFLSDLSSQHQQNIRTNSSTDDLIQSSSQLFGRVKKNLALRESTASASGETSQSKRSLPSQAESSKSNQMQPFSCKLPNLL